MDNLAEGTPRVPGKIKFFDFAPDADPILPGALLEMTNLYPSAKGWRTYPRLTRYSDNELPGACIGAFSGLIGDDVVALAGTADKLLFLQGTTLVDSGLTPTSTAGRWRFDFYSDEVIAVNGVNAPYVYDGVTFGNLPGSPPVAGIVQATEYALFLILANSSTWIASLNHNIWTPSIATATVTGSLSHGTGNITAAHRLRGGIAFYKRKHISYGQYQGPPFYWDFGNGVSDEIGTPCQEAVANLGDVHYFVGPEDFYSFDGYSLQRIPNHLKEWFFENLNQTLAHLIVARWDQSRNLIFWHFPSNAASPETALDSWVCFNLRTGKWSADKEATLIDVPLFSTIETGQLTYDVLTTTYPTYGDMDFAYGDLQSRTTEKSGAFRTSDHALALYNGLPGASSYTTHDFGDRSNLYQVTGIRPHYAIHPAGGATIQPLNQRIPGKAPVAGTARALSADGKFDFMNTARLQRFKHVANSECEVVGMDVNIEYAGEQ